MNGNRIVVGTVLILLAASPGMASGAVIFGNSGLANGWRWDAAPRNVFGRERSLDGGLRYSLQGGSFLAYRNVFNWSGSVPSVASFQTAVETAFAAWTAVDPASNLGTDVSFTQDFATPVVDQPGGGVNMAGAEIDLLGATDASFWNPGDPGLRAETWFNGQFGTSVELTSGTVGYAGHAIGGADITMNSNSQAFWNLPWFQLILTHEIGHALGLGDVDIHGPNGLFIDDNYNGSSSAAALATLTNSWAGLVDTAAPSASPLALYTVNDANPGVDTPGVNILMETNIPPALLNNNTPLQNDDYGGRQFLYPWMPEPFLESDFDSDGDVDGDDFLAWQSGFGNGTTREEGDADSDGDVDGDDFLVWQTQFGNASKGEAAGHAVPEPASVFLIGILGSLLIGTCRNRGVLESP